MKKELKPFKYEFPTLVKFFCDSSVPINLKQEIETLGELYDRFIYEPAEEGRILNIEENSPEVIFKGDKTESIMKDFFDDIVNASKRRTEYFNSPEIKKDLEYIRKYLQTHGSIDDEHLAYFPEELPEIKVDQLRTIVSSVTENIGEDKIRVRDIGFQNIFCDWEGLRFAVTSGQGTLSSISLISGEGDVFWKEITNPTIKSMMGNV